MACRLPPNINSPLEFWSFLKNGIIADSRIPATRIPTRNNLLKKKFVEGGNFLQQDISGFDTTFFNISRLEAESMDPQQRLLLECVYECMENSGLTVLNEKTGFFIGLMGTEYADIAETLNKRDMLTMLGSATSIFSGRLNHYFDAKGPSLTVDTACSSSLTCLNLAIQSLNNGDCNRAVVAGINLILTEKGLHQRASGKMISWDGACRTFDNNASGYGRADGCVALIIEKAKHNCYYEAYIESIKINHDGKSTALTAPNPKAQAQLIKDCLKRIKKRNNLFFWECHGTGTSLGDPLEYIALNNALEQLNTKNKIFISSAKSNIGHSEAASGLVGVLKAILQLQHNYIPQIPRFCLLNKQILKNQSNLLKLPICGVELTKKSGFCGVSSFGISGTNVCCLLSVNLIKKKNFFYTKLFILPVSGKSTRSLNQNIKNFLKAILKSCRLKKKFFISAFCAAAALQRNHYLMRSVILFKISKTFYKPFVILKNKKQKKGFIFVLDFWSKFNPEFMQTIALYAKIFFKILEQFNITLIELLQKKINKKLLTLIDTFTKFKILLEIGIQPTNYIILNGKENLGNNIKKFLNNVVTKDTKQLIINCFHDVQTKQQNYTSEKNLNFYTIGTGNTDFPLENLKSFEKLISTAYLSNVNIKWEMLYILNKTQHYLNRKKIKLPNYSFDRQVFWIKKDFKIFDNNLIGNIIYEDNTQITFENLLSKTRFPFLNCVKINNKNIFPFGVLLEMLIIAVWTQSYNNVMCINNISIQNVYDLSLVNEIWVTTKIDKIKKMIEILDLNKKVILCQAYFEVVSTNYTESVQISQNLQNINIIELSNIIENINKIINNDVLKIKSYLEKNKNVIKVFLKKTYYNNCTINSILLEEFAQFIQNYIMKNNYQNLGDTITRLEIYKTAKNYCYIKTYNNIIEFYDKNDQICIKIFFNFLLKKTIKKHAQLLPNKKKIFLNVKIDKTEVLNTIKNALEDSLMQNKKIDKNYYNVGFIDLGLDSLSLIGFLNKLLELFPHVEISSTDLFSNPNLNALTDFISKKLSNIAIQNKNNLLTENNSNFNLSKDKNKPTDAIVYNKKNVFCYKLNLYKKKKPLLYSKLTIYFKNNIYKLKLYFDNKLEKKWIIKHKIDSKFFMKILSNIKKFFNNNSAHICFCIVGREIKLQKLSKLLLQFSKALLQTFNNSLSKIFLYFNQEKKSAVLSNAFCKGFFKSLAAEKFLQINIVENYFLEKIQLLNNFSSNLKLSETWLITGGTNGIGFEMVEYLAFNFNISFIAVLARNKISDNLEERVKKINKICKLKFYQVDISIYKEVENVFFNLKKKNLKLEGVIHSAGCIDDAVIEYQNKNKFFNVIKPKCYGIRNIAKSIKKCNYFPKYFIFNSSVSSIFGNKAQTNYSAANLYCSEYIKKYHIQNSVGTVIYWGNWLETGMALRAGVNSLLQLNGFDGLTTNEAMRYFRYVLENQPREIVIANINWKKFLVNRPDLNKTIINYKKKKNLLIFEKKNLQLYLIKIIKKFVSHSNKNVNNTFIDHNIGFIELGLDSLQLYHFTNKLNKNLKKYSKSPNFNITVMNMFEHKNIENLTNYIWEKFFVQKNLKYKNNTLNKVNEIINISKENYDIILNHQIEKKIIVPAAFQIHLFENYQKIKNVNLNKICLSDISFQNKINDNFLNNIKIVENNKNQVELKSAKDEKLIFSYCVINKTFDFFDIEKIFYSIIKIKMSKKNKLNKNFVYKNLKINGISYKNELRLLKNIYVCSDCVVAEVNIKNLQFTSTTDWILYDLALQALSIILLESNSFLYYIPLHIKAISKECNIDYNNITNIKILGKVYLRHENIIKGSLIIQLNKKNCIFIEEVTALRVCNSHEKKKLKKQTIKTSFLKKSTSLNKGNNCKKKKSKTHDKFKNCKNNKDSLKNEKRIMIIGWSKLLDAKTYKNYKKFDAEYFNITPKEAPFIDPQQRWLLEAVVEAMESAQIAFLPKKTGIFIGASSSDFAQKAYSELPEAAGYLSTGTNASVLSGRLAHFFGATGPVATVDTACSSFSTALSKACDALLLNKCQYALVGAVNVILNKKTTKVLKNFGVLSKKNCCSTFDISADGYLRSNGVGVIIITKENTKTLELHSKYNKIFYVTSWVIGHTGHRTASFTASNSDAQFQVMKKALEQAHLKTIDLIECHGSATPLGDPIEIASILKSFSCQNQLLLTASKTKYGHAEAASGIIALLNVLNILNKSYIDPINHFCLINPKIKIMNDFFKLKLPIIGMETNLNRVMINNFGFSGTNGNFIISKQKKIIENKLNVLTKTKILNSSLLLIFSAKTKKSLLMYKKKLSLFVQNKNCYQMSCICNILQNNRPHFDYRYAKILNLIDNSSTKIVKLMSLEKKLNVIVDFIPNAHLCLEELLNNHNGIYESYLKIQKIQLKKKITLSAEDLILITIIYFLLSLKINIGNIIVVDKLRLRNFKKFHKLKKIVTENSNLLNFVNLSQIINYKNYQIRPSFSLNYFCGQLYLSNKLSNFKFFNSKQNFYSNVIQNIPCYCFQKKFYWPFKKKNKKNLNFIKNKKKNYSTTYAITFKKVKKIQIVDKLFITEKFILLNFVPIVNYNLKLNFLSAIDLTKTFSNLDGLKINCFSFLVIWKITKNVNKSIKYLINLSKFISYLQNNQRLKFLILIESPVSINSDICAFIRSAACEYSNLCYRVIYFSNLIKYNSNLIETIIKQQFDEMLKPSNSDVFKITLEGNILQQRLTAVKKKNITSRKTKKNCNNWRKWRNW